MQIWFSGGGGGCEISTRSIFPSDGAWWRWKCEYEAGVGGIGMFIKWNKQNCDVYVTLWPRALCYARNFMKIDIKFWYFVYSKSIRRKSGKQIPDILMQPRLVFKVRASGGGLAEFKSFVHNDGMKSQQSMHDGSILELLLVSVF